MHKNNDIQEGNDKIFQFLTPQNNNKLSDMKCYDLQDFLILLDEYYLKLRNKLNFDSKTTFGVELEFENGNRSRIENEIATEFPYNTWKVKSDGSLHKGAEINSPILHDRLVSWKDLKKVCEIVEPLAIIGKKSGGHIHIGAHVLGDKKEAWCNLLKIWSVYENIIYRFSYGEFLNPRLSMDSYAEAMAKEFWKAYISTKHEEVDIGTLISNVNLDRYQAINFNNIEYYDKFSNNNTIEFRCPNGTLDPVIWQNNINLFVKLLYLSKSNNFDDDIIEERHRTKLKHYSSFKWYNELYIDQALEFSDLLFNNNLDKIYFLRQYFKSFEVINETSDNLIPAKKFTK